MGQATKYNAFIEKAMFIAGTLQRCDLETAVMVMTTATATNC